MQIALADNPQHIQQLCAQLQLGVPALPISSVQGGFHHRMWRLQTDQGLYAIKQLAADTDLANPLVIAHFNFTESVAETFRAYGIRAISALHQQGKYLQLLDNNAYLVYPWSEAKGLDINQRSQQHALEVARMLAVMHCADIELAAPDAAAIDFDQQQKIIDVVQRCVQLQVSYAAELAVKLPEFLQMASASSEAMPVLAQHLVISHGDLDQKNVLWDSDSHALVIDWESAGKLNPTYELLQTALEWSGITRHFDSGLFESFLLAYQQAGGIIDRACVQPAFQCILGDWLNWLLYVVDRSANSDNPRKRKRGTEQFELVLPTLLRLQALLPTLLALPALQQPGSDK